MRFAATCAFALIAAAPAVAQELTVTGDATAGETAFARQCIACHQVVNADGEKLAGRNGRVGPNLYGVAGAPIAHVEGFAYGDSIKELNAQGKTWDEDSFVGYVTDPTRWLRDALGDPRARGKMAFKVRDEQDARDIFAYLHSLAQ